jgi:hypothetical protein
VRAEMAGSGPAMTGSFGDWYITIVLPAPELMEFVRGSAL